MLEPFGPFGEVSVLGLEPFGVEPLGTVWASEPVGTAWNAGSALNSLFLYDFLLKNESF
jgi:hypothetical protein